MPHISNDTITVENNGLKNHFQVKIMYTGDLLFHIVVPAEWKEKISAMSADEIRGISMKHKAGRGNTPDQYCVCADTETLVKSKFKEAANFIHALQVEVNPVIIVFFYEGINWSNSDIHGDYKPIGLQFGMVYAKEARNNDNGKKVYFTEKEHRMPSFGDKKGDVLISRSYISIGKNHKIIPDTTESREYLSKMYGTIQAISDGLKNLTATPESIMQFIQAKTNLLNPPEEVKEVLHYDEIMSK